MTSSKVYVNLWKLSWHSACDIKIALNMIPLKYDSFERHHVFFWTQWLSNKKNTHVQVLLYVTSIWEVGQSYQPKDKIKFLIILPQWSWRVSTIE